MLQLEAIVRPAQKLKSLLEIIRELDSDEGSMHVQDDRIHISVVNNSQTATILIWLHSGWFFHYNLRAPTHSWTFTFSIYVLCGLLGYAHNNDDIIIRGDINTDDESRDGHLKLSFVDIEHETSQTHWLPVRGSPSPFLPPLDMWDGGFRVEITPQSLSPHLEYCSTNDLTFVLTFTTAAVTVTVGQEYTHNLIAETDYTMRNVQQATRPSYVARVYPQDTEHLNRAVLRSSSIAVKTGFLRSPMIVAYLEGTNAWCEFSTIAPHVPDRRRPGRPGF